MNKKIDESHRAEVVRYITSGYANFMVKSK